MARSSNREVVRHLRTLFNVGSMAGLTDAELLGRFLAGPSEAAELAFAALMERHGPMVWRVCRRALRDAHDADDAFQATFLVLVRRAGAIHRWDSLASWLHGVALRVASAARTRALRRQTHEGRKGAERMATASASASGGEDQSELGAVLHEELGRLPRRLRDTAILCLLEGVRQEDAALRLGCPVGTVKSRLAAARQRLQGRLVRRGFAPSVGLLGTALAAEASASSPPTALVDSTIRAAMRVAAPHAAAAGAVSASVAALTEGVLKAMLITKVKLVFAGVLAVSLLGIGVTWAQSNPDHAAPDRLGVLERKLDRVLEALERNTAPLSEVQGQYREARLVQPAAGEALPRLAEVARVTSQSSAAPAAGAAAGTTDIARLERLEHRVDELAARLERLERRLDGQPAGAGPFGTTHNPGERGR